MSGFGEVQEPVAQRPVQPAARPDSALPADLQLAADSVDHLDQALELPADLEASGDEDQPDEALELPTDLEALDDDELSDPDAESDTEALNELRRLENMARREGDARLREDMVAEQFTGPLYARFEHEMIRYALASLNAWMRNGFIFHLVARRRGHSGVRINLHPTEHELRELKEDEDLRMALAGDVVAETLPRFSPDPPMIMVG